MATAYEVTPAEPVTFYEPPPTAEQQAWPTPPTQSQPVLSAADQAQCTALFNSLKPRAQINYVDFFLSRTPTAWQDFMIGLVGPSAAP
jgi:hypothetical protein